MDVVMCVAFFVHIISYAHINHHVTKEINLPSSWLAAAVPPDCIFPAKNKFSYSAQSLSKDYENLWKRYNATNAIEHLGQTFWNLALCYENNDIRMQKIQENNRELRTSDDFMSSVLAVHAVLFCLGFAKRICIQNSILWRTFLFLINSRRNDSISGESGFSYVFKRATQTSKFKL